MNAVTAPSQYDDFAWFYDKYWGGGPGSFTTRVLPIIDRLVLTHTPAAGRVLDLCCGTGQLAHELTTRGYRVTGVDGSAEMLRFARHRAPGVEFIQADARAFSLPTQVDAALCMYDSLNHLMQPADLSAAFRQVRRTLKPGGRFLCDFNMQAGFEARWRGSFGISGDDHALVYRAAYDANANVGKSTMTMFRLQQDVWRRSDVTVHERCYAAEEITSALQAVGFTDVAIFDASRDLGLPEQAEAGRSFFLSRAS